MKQDLDLFTSYLVECTKHFQGAQGQDRYFHVHSQVPRNARMYKTHNWLHMSTILHPTNFVFFSLF